MTRRIINPSTGSVLLLVLAVWVASPSAFAQDAATKTAIASPQAVHLPKFEVASIRPNPHGGIAGIRTYPGGRIRCQFCMLEWLVMFAFDLKAYQILGGPDWIHREGYSIDAEPPASSESSKLNPPSPNSPLSEEQRLMLQALLIDRFGLRYHFETREGHVYWLVRTSKQLKLTKAKDPTKPPYMNVKVYHNGVDNGEMVGSNASMALMAQRLSDILESTVEDKTGVEGSFDFDLPAPEAANADLTNATLEGLETLGLRLKSVKGKVHVLVVEDATRPSNN